MTEKNDTERSEQETLEALATTPCSAGLDCPIPHCGNSGGYPEMYLDGHGREQVEHVQCEWCWTTPNSKFNLSQNTERTGGEPEQKGNDNE